MIAEQFQEFKTVLIHTLPVSLSSNKNNGDSQKIDFVNRPYTKKMGNTA
jgi:hypothetical protein